MAVRKLNIYRRRDGRYEGRYRCRAGKMKYFYGHIEAEVARTMILFIAKDLEGEEDAPDWDLEVRTESAVKKSIAASKTAAELAAAKGSETAKARKEAVAIGVRGKAGKKAGRKGRRSGRTLDEVAQRWIKERSMEDKESSVGTYSSYLRLYISPKFGERDVRGIDRKEAYNYFLALSQGGQEMEEGGDDSPASVAKPLSIGTVNEAIRIMNSLMRFAEDEGLCGSFGKIQRLKGEAAKEQVVMPTADRDKLEEHIRENPCRTNIGVYLVLHTGIRVGELCALKWGDIDLEGGTIMVRHTLQRIRDLGEGRRKTKVVLTDPKSASSVRAIPLVDEVIDIIKENYAGYGSCDPDAYFLTGKKDRFIEPRLMERKFAQLLEEAGVGRIRFHGMRHGFSTLCIEARIDPKSVSDMMGHSSPAITLALYSHPSMKHKKESLARAFSKNEGSEG